jgi:hypothetical protein
MMSFEKNDVHTYIPSISHLYLYGLTINQLITMFVLFLISFDVGRCSLKVIGAEKSERWGLMERPIFNPCFLGQEIWPTNLIPMWTQKVSSVPGSFSEGNHLDKFDHTLMARRQ